tara:strand:- start:53440 stop:54144 length:705 start_codon:yes stop_codon:yes gene_type:complete
MYSVQGAGYKVQHIAFEVKVYTILIGNKELCILSHGKHYWSNIPGRLIRKASPGLTAIAISLLGLISGCGAVSTVSKGLNKLLADPDVSKDAKQQIMDHQEALAAIAQMGIIVWIGSLLFAGSAIMGGLMIYRGRPGGISVISVIGGSGLAMALFAHLFARYGIYILIACSVPLTVYFLSVVWRNGWFLKELSPEVEQRLQKEGDHHGAGAIHRARTGNAVAAKKISLNGMQGG